MREGRRVLQLTSQHNPLIKEIRRAVAKGTLTRDGFLIAEGFHSVEEAISSGCEIKAILSAESQQEAAMRFRSAKLATIPDKLFDDISSTDTPQGIMGLVRPREWTWNDVVRETPLLMILDRLQDPGNVGAILRSAEAFGATGVVFLKHTVAPYNPKAVRASAGSIFRLPVLTGVEAPDAVNILRGRGIELFAAMPNARMSLLDSDLTRPSAIVIGGEGPGVSEEIGGWATPIRIPTHRVESLNAAVAAAILIYEAWRQRGQPI